MGEIVSLDEWRERRRELAADCIGAVRAIDELDQLRLAICDIERLARRRFGEGPVRPDVVRAVGEVIGHLGRGDVPSALRRAERLTAMLEADVG